MKTYTLKLKTTSTTNYNLYDGTTLVSDADLGTLFGSAGEAYFTFDFDSLTPTDTTSLTILNSQDTAVITNTGLSGIAEDKNFKGTWSASATAFDSFTLLGGVAMDEAQLSKLVGLAKDGKIKTLTTADYDYRIGESDPGINIYALEKGCIYKIKKGVRFWLQYHSTSSRQKTFFSDRDGFLVIPGLKTPSGFGETFYAFFVGATSEGGGSRTAVSPGQTLAVETNNADSSMPDNYVQVYVHTTIVIDSLTSTKATFSLSANQGKVLADRIGNLSTLTTTAKTSAVAAINELDSDLGGLKLVSISQTDYDALATKDPNTLYVITGA